MSDTHWIRPGIELRWEDRQVVIRKVGADVVISDPDGSRQRTVPITDIAQALRGDTAPLDSPRLHGLEQRLSPGALERLDSDTDLLHIMLTGRHADQPDTDTPPAALDPDRWPEDVRRSRLARLLADKKRSKGASRGYSVLYRSEMRRLQRVKERWTDRQTLVDKRYTRPPAARTTDAVVDALLTFMDGHALKSTRSDIALVRSFKISCAQKHPAMVLPSDRTLRRRVAENRRGWSHLGASAKNRISELNVPEASGMTRLASRPGELVLFDTTKSNVWVKDPRTGRTLRLDVTLAIDLATRCVVGLAITHTTTKFAIGLCLADVLRPKSATLAAAWATDPDTPQVQPFIGRPNTCASFYSAAFHPEGVVVDNGKQYVSNYVTSQMGRLGIHYEPQRSYSPTDKPQVERVFRTVKDMFESLMPGFTGGSVHERGKNPEAEELMSTSEFERRLRQCIDFYNHRTHEGLVHPKDPFARLSPFTMYNILIDEVGAIADLDYKHDWVRFLPSVAVKISRSRVQVKRLKYTNPVLRRLQGDPMVKKTGKLRVFYDPFDLRVVWCFDAEGAIHVLRWHLLTEHTQRFDEFYTTGLVKAHSGTALSGHDAERILVEIFTSKHDASPSEAIHHHELGDTLMQEAAANLTRGELPYLQAADDVILADVPTNTIRKPRPAKRSPQTRNNSPVLVLDSTATDEDAAGAQAPTATAGRRPRRALQPYNPYRF